MSLRAKATKLLEKLTEVNFCDFGLGKAFLDVTQKCKRRLINWTSSKLEIFVLPMTLSRK